jgi:hypothetical protein
MNTNELKTMFYDNLRNITNIEQKIAISTVFLYYHQKGGIELAKFLYKLKTYKNAVDDLKIKTKDWEVNFMEGTPEMELAFKECRKTYIKKYDPVDSKGRKLYEEANKGCPHALMVFELAQEFRKFRS